MKRYVKEKGGQPPADLDEQADRIARMGGTPLAVAIGKEILGLIYLKNGETWHEGTLQSIASHGDRTIMCTGDNPLTASTIAKEAGVDDFIAESTPEDKIRVIREEQEQGKLVAMTGDGTNDAPALAQADVGLAMNSGTVAAKEVANMVDLDSDPSKIIDVAESASNS